MFDLSRVNGRTEIDPSLLDVSRVARRDALDRRARTHVRRTVRARVALRRRVRGKLQSIHGGAPRVRRRRARRRLRGAGARVKLPGASRDDPNVYAFDDISYEDIASDLERQPRETVETTRRMFDMLRRNAKIKPRPNRWQTHSDAERFDVVVCFEERVFDLVVRDLREKEKARPPCAAGGERGGQGQSRRERGGGAEGVEVVSGVGGE